MRRTIFLAALAPSVWGTTYAVTAAWLPEGRPLLAATLRALPIGVLFTLVGNRLPVGIWWARAFVLGALNFGVFFALLFTAAYRLPGGIAATVGATQPIIVMVLLAALLSERPTARRAVAGVAGVAGVGLLVLKGDATLDLVGVLAAAGAAASMATGTVLVQRWGRPVALLTFAGWQLAAGGLLLAPVALLTEGLPSRLSAANVGGYLYLMIIGAGVAYPLWFRGIERLGAGTAAFLGLLSPVVATITGVVVRNETLTWFQALGIVAVLGSVAIGQRTRRAAVVVATEEHGPAMRSPHDQNTGAVCVLQRDPPRARVPDDDGRPGACPASRNRTADAGVDLAMNRHLGVVVVALSLLSTVAVPGAHAEATSSPPTLRLVQTVERVTLQRFDGHVQLDLGVYAAAVGGEFRIDVRRDGWAGPISATQNGRVLPPALLDGFGGMKRFLRVTFSQRGERVRSAWLTFCPNGWDRQRMDDTGPQHPTFPDLCPTHFPFTRAMTWGIDAGWATAVAAPYTEGPAAFDVPPGTYDVTVEVHPRWVDVLRMHPDATTVQLRATVVQEAAPTEEPRPNESGHADGHSAAATTTKAAPSEARLPDLAALPAWRLTATREGGRDQLSFAATPWNAGTGPFIVEGFRRRGERVMDAFQYFHDASGRVVGRAPAGEMAFHAGGGHDHWHFSQFASFELESADAGRVVRSQKQGFCMAATDPVDLAAPGAVLRPYETGLTSACGGERALWVREVLPAGWGDTYFNVSGQAFDITDLPNGRYLVRVTVDPFGQLHQTTRSNDVAERAVVLGGRRGARTVHAEPWNGVADEPGADAP